VVGLAGTAAANPGNSGVDSPRLVDGFGAVTDDWGDHFSELGNSLCNGCADSFNIDGQFGPITANATWRWQERYQIGRDGQVGIQTWTRADDLLCGVSM
jgi:peptidoglycan hydrolase-like protein with peptidoglycan-binding domain